MSRPANTRVERVSEWWCAIGVDRGACAHAGYQVLFPSMPPEDNYTSSDVEKVGVLYHSSFSGIVKCPNFYSRSAGSVVNAPQWFYDCLTLEPKLLTDVGQNSIEPRPLSNETR